MRRDRPKPDPSRSHMTSQRELTSARALAAISELHATTPSDRNVSAMLEAILDQTIATLGANAAYVRLSSADRERLTLAAERNIPIAWTGRQSDISIHGDTPEGRVARERSVLMIGRDGDVSTPASRELLERTECACLVHVPLETVGELVGVLSYAQKRAHHFSFSEIEALRAMASAFAAGLRSSLRLEHLLGERVKELKTLRGATRTLQRSVDDDREPLRKICESLPLGWQYPDVSAARIRVGEIEVRTDNFELTEWIQSAEFTTSSGQHGRIDVVYLAPRPEESEGPFLAEERELINSLADLLCAYFERREAESSLRTSEERLRVALKNAPVIVSHQDCDLKYIWVYNQPAAWNIDRVGKTDMDYLPAADAEHLTHLKRQVLRTGIGNRSEIRKTIGTREYFYDLTIEPLRDSSARVVGITSAAVDITHRTEFERARERLVEQLATERNRLDAVLDQMPGAVILTDARGLVMLQNQAALELGATKASNGDEVIALDVRWPSGEPPAPADLPLSKAIHEGVTTRSIELLIRRADGELIPVLASAAPIRGPSLELVGGVAVFQDIIRLKHLERLREEWTSIIAHDLRQPLMTILVSAAVLDQHSLEHGCGAACAAPQRALHHIVKSAKRIERMIGDLMDVSLIESQRLTLDVKEVDVHSLITEVLDWMGPQLERHPAHLEVRGCIRPIHADRGRIEQVLTNLLSNAVKYGDADTPIDIGIDARKDALEISITNRGRGLDECELKSIFARFRRGRAATGATGVGLGLYISKGLVEAHGGHIWAESTPGATTTFRFTLPARQPQSSAHAMLQPEARS